MGWKNVITNNEVRGYTLRLASVFQRENDLVLPHPPNVFRFFPKWFAFSGTFAVRPAWPIRSVCTGVIRCVWWIAVRVRYVIRYCTIRCDVDGMLYVVRCVVLHYLLLVCVWWVIWCGYVCCVALLHANSVTSSRCIMSGVVLAAYGTSTVWWW